jgi:cytochrome c-type biogenesis protein CcmF
MQQKSDSIIWVMVVANMDISRNGKSAGSIHPNMIIQYVMSGQTVTEMPSVVSNKVVIRSNLAEDYYVIFEDFDGTTNQGKVKVLINPLVQWIWIGGFLLLIGGLVSFSAMPRKITAGEDKDQSESSG